MDRLRRIAARPAWRVVAVALLVLVVAACRPAPPTGAGSVDDAPSVPALHPAIDQLDEAVVAIGDERFHVKVAADAPARRQGLMEVEELPEGVGMLFLFDRPRTGGFWMYRTLVALDIAFIAEDGTVGELARMDPCRAASSGDCPTTTPDDPYRAALEVPAGALDGIEPGDPVGWSSPVPPER